VFFVHGLLFASWTAHIPHVKQHLEASDGLLGLALLGAPLGSVLAMVVAARVLPESDRRRGRFDLPGAITGTLGLGALV